jgi:transposase
LGRKVNNKADKKKQLWILNNHPAFTGICSNCGFEYEKSLFILDVDNKSHHWNCPQCGLSYD